MNEFTREELLVIWHDVGILNDEARTSYEHASSEFIINLRNKLQSMIDNYDARGIEVWRCEKCGHGQ